MSLSERDTIDTEAQMALFLHGRMWERTKDWFFGDAIGSFFIATSIPQVYWRDGRPLAARSGLWSGSVVGAR